MVVKLDSKSKIKKEDELLLCCSSSNLESVSLTKIQSLVHENLDWDYIVQMANANSLKPILYWNLRKITPTKVPDEIIYYLKDYFSTNVQKNLLMYGELLRILKIFNLNNIDTVPYKGPLLSIEAYGNIAFRDFSDIDIYVDKNDLLRLKEILLQESYEPELDLKPEIEKRYIDTQRELKFFNRKLGVTLEVHWDFKPLFLSAPKNFHIFNKEKSFVYNIDNVPVIQPSFEDMFIILAIHNAGHRWSKISWVCDIKEFVNIYNLNWLKIQRKARRLKIEKILYINLYLAHNLLGLEIPDSIEKHSRNVDFEHLLAQFEQRLLKVEHNPLTLSEEVFFSFKLRDTFFYGIKDVLKGLTNPTIYEWTSFPLPSFLQMFYFIYRPFNLIWRHKWK